MSRQANPTVIGGFVLGALILVVVAIIVFGSGAWFMKRVSVVTYFPGSVQGLSVGAQVQFDGVQIGQVTAIGLDYMTTTTSFRIPVTYDIWPSAIDVVGETDGALDPEAFAKRLVAERGLRAKLESVSLVTGQYVVSLGLGTATPPRYVGSGGRGIEIPAIESARDQVTDILQKLPLDDLVAGATGTLAALRSLLESGAIQALIGHLDDTATRVGRLSSDIDTQVKPMGEQFTRTLAQTAALAERLTARVDGLADGVEGAAGDVSRASRNLDARIGPLVAAADAALRRADKTLATLEGVVAQGSDLRYRLNQLLTEATGAARSLRTLADYLERHPEALLQGKR
jgi:paraquat-inducible protein B